MEQGVFQQRRNKAIERKEAGEPFVAWLVIDFSGQG